MKQKTTNLKVIVHNKPSKKQAEEKIKKLCQLLEQLKIGETYE